MQPAISVIMPAYNSQSFIRKAIEACLNQTFKGFEMIIVDDGSKDKTGMIIDEYAKRDSRIKCIHINNGGASNARNTGLNNASGKYVHFCDSDDFIEKDMYEKMLRPTLEFEYDLVCCGMMLEFASGRKIESNKKILLQPYDCRDASGFVKGFDILYNNNNTIASTCNKLFKREALKEFNILFDTSLRNREDTKFCYTFLTKANSMFFVSDALYHYQSRGQDVSLSDTYAPHTVQTADFLINCIAEIVRRMNLPEKEVLDKSIFYSSSLYHENIIWLKSFCKNKNPFEVITVLEQILHSDYAKTTQKTRSGKLLLNKYLAGISSFFFLYLKSVAGENYSNYFDYLIKSGKLNEYIKNNNFLPLYLLHQELKEKKQLDMALIVLIALLNNKNNVNKIPDYSLEEYLEYYKDDSTLMAQAELLQNSKTTGFLSECNISGVAEDCNNKSDFGRQLLFINCLILSNNSDSALKLCWNCIFEGSLNCDEMLVMRKKLDFIAEQYKLPHIAKMSDFIFENSSMLNYIKNKDFSSAYNYTARYIKSNRTLYNIYVYNLLLAKIAVCAKNVNLAAQAYIEGVLSPLNNTRTGKDEFIEFLRDNKLTELLNELQAILNGK